MADIIWTKTASQTYSATVNGKLIAVVKYFGKGLKWMTEVYPMDAAQAPRTLATSQPTLKRAKVLAAAFAI